MTKIALRNFPAQAILFAAAMLCWPSSSAQTAPTQIGPGTTASPNSTQKVGPATGGQPKKMLDQALTPQTRRTLQEAMNSAPSEGTKPNREVTLGPGEGAKLSGSNAEKVPYKTLPAPVKKALGGGVKDNLGGSQGH
jgi:hypothetical protein